MSVVRRALAVLVVASAVVLGSASGAAAHASLVSSDPADGATLGTAPSSVTLTFSEPPDPTLSAVHVLDRAGHEVEDGSVAPVPGRPKELRVPLGALPDGVYTVTWRVVSSTDGHVTANAFSFGVGVSPAGTSAPPGASAIPTTPPPSPLSVAGRWALYVGLALLLAAGTTGQIAFEGRLPARRRILVGAWLAAAAGTVAMIAAERSAVDVGLGTLLSSAAGSRLVWLAEAVLVCGAATWVAAVRGGRGPMVVVAVTAAAAMLARAVGGHAGSSSPAAVEVGLQWFHLLGVGLWIGGLGWLVAVLLGGHPEGRAVQVRRFSRIAGYGLGLVVVTGVLRATDELGGLGEALHAFGTSYGTTLAIKAAIALALIGFGALNRYRNLPRLTDDEPAPLRRSVTAELVLAAGVLGLTGVLTGLPPATTAATAASSAARPLVVTGSDFATTTRVRLEVAPGRVGPNRFVATVTDYDSGAPVDAERVTLDFSLPGRPDVGSTMPLERGSGGSWSADGTALAQFGRWDVSVLVQTGGGSTEVPLTLEPKTPPERVTVSRAAGQPDLYTIAMAGGLQIQSYLDPGTPGANQLHVTAFGEGGRELPLRSADLVAVDPSGTTRTLHAVRFGAGHFAANLDLAPGRWRFYVSATARDGRPLVASFEQTVAG